jgi:hypothetical protein
MTTELKKGFQDYLENGKTPIRHLILSYPAYQTIANLDTLELKKIIKRIGKDDEYIIKSNLGDISISVDSAEEISNWFRESGKLLSADLVSGTKELSNNYHHNTPISTSLQALFDKLKAKKLLTLL